MRRKVIVGLSLGVAATVASVWLASAQDQKPDVNAETHSMDSKMQEPAEIAINIPDFSQSAKSGEIAFNENCAVCHGSNATGTEQGPPLVHKIYEPSHHGDLSFELAAKNGVRAHHWRFGNMPPVEGITDAKIRWITAYIRELQVANGID